MSELSGATFAIGALGRDMVADERAGALDGERREHPGLCASGAFAGAGRVSEIRSASGFADARCVWFRVVDLALPGEGDEPLLRAARARKASASRKALS